MSGWGRELYIGWVKLKVYWEVELPSVYVCLCCLCSAEQVNYNFKTYTYVTVPGKRALVAQIMIFLYRRFSAATPKNNSRDKTFVFVSEVSPTLCLHSR